jgi:hypothetical protein
LEFFFGWFLELRTAQQGRNKAERKRRKANNDTNPHREILELKKLTRVFRDSARNEGQEASRK